MFFKFIDLCVFKCVKYFFFLVYLYRYNEYLNYLLFIKLIFCFYLWEFFDRGCCLVLVDFLWVFFFFFFMIDFFFFIVIFWFLVFFKIRSRIWVCFWFWRIVDFFVFIVLMCGEFVFCFVFVVSVIGCIIFSSFCIGVVY